MSKIKGKVKQNSRFNAIIYSMDSDSFKDIPGCNRHKFQLDWKEEWI